MNYIYIIIVLASSVSCISSQRSHTFKIGEKKIDVEVSDTHEKRQKGLMHRKSLKKDHGMLFVFDKEQKLGFWMKNTLIPLSIGFFNKECELVGTQEMVPAAKKESMPPTYYSSGPALYALEMNKNWFSNNNIKIKEKIIALSKDISFCK